MNGLRWLLAATTGLVLLAYLGLAVVGGGFRRSFGASDAGQWKVVLAGAILGALFLSLILPIHRGVLHGAAILVVGVAIGACALLKESAFLGLSGLAYAALWLLWYWQTAWSRPATPPG